MNWKEHSALNLWNPGYPAYDFYEKNKIFQSPRNKRLAPGTTGSAIA